MLRLCAKAGLVGVKFVAVDGRTVAANEPHNDERFARQVDAEEDERFGERRGDELPPESTTFNGREKWFKRPVVGWMTKAPSKRRRLRITPAARRSPGRRDGPWGSE